MTKRYQQYLAATVIDQILSKLPEAHIVTGIMLVEKSYTDRADVDVTLTKHHTLPGGDDEIADKFARLYPDARPVKTYSKSRTYLLERHGQRIHIDFLYARKQTEEEE